MTGSMTLDQEEPLGRAVVDAIHRGDEAALRRLLTENRELAKATIRNLKCGAEFRSLLHVATDFPGHFPNGAATVRALVDAGAEVNGRFAGGTHTETPLHWAASSDDVQVLEALLDCGADIDAPGGVIGGGGPIEDAVAFGQWNAARRLVERGARTNLWQAAAMGLESRVAELAADRSCSVDDLTNAFWCACHGGQQKPAEYLLDRGANLNWVGHDRLTPLDAAVRENRTELAQWLRARGAKSIQELQS